MANNGYANFFFPGWRDGGVVNKMRYGLCENGERLWGLKEQDLQFARYEKEKRWCILVVVKEGHSQLEIDDLFKDLVLPNLVYGFSVYEASEAELQCLLNRCFKHNYISHNVNTRELLKKTEELTENCLRPGSDAELFISRT